MSNITVVHGKCFHNLLVTWIETIHAPAEKKLESTLKTKNYWDNLLL